MFKVVDARRGILYRAAVAGLVAVAVGLGLGGLVVAGGSHRSPAASHDLGSDVDPSLIIVPRTTSVEARLVGGARLHGTLSPTIPGINVLHLVLRNKAGTIITGGRVRLSMTMPGMGMAPIIAGLGSDGPGYSGAMHLPMFGHYRAKVLVSTPTEHFSGTLTLSLQPPAVSIPVGTAHGGGAHVAG